MLGRHLFSSWTLGATRGRHPKLVRVKMTIGARRIGSIWHGYIEGRSLPDDGSLRALTRQLALDKAERIARKIADHEGATSVQILRIER